MNADEENIIDDKSTITPKTYGPFNMTVPKLGSNDMYKYKIYTLLQNNFTILSTQTIATVGAIISTHNKQFFKHHKAGVPKLNSFFFGQTVSY